MMAFRVEVLGEGIDHCKTYEDYEFESALIYFLQQERSDRKVILTAIGEEYEEE